jgi:5-methylcytosine-specific restriction endonuclease McrA
VISWDKAIGLLLREAAYTVVAYTDIFVRSTSMRIPLPAVLVRKKHTRKLRSVRRNRQGLLARDAYTCGYCGLRPRKKDGTPDGDKLTVDHVIPRAQADKGFVSVRGQRVHVNDWINVVASCSPCNHTKGARTPTEAGMPLRFKPRRPNALDLARMRVYGHVIPDEWRDYLVADSPWRTA